MRTPTLEHPVTDGVAPPVRVGRKRWLLVAAVVAVAAVTVAAGLAAAGARDPERVALDFPEGTQVLDTEWGNEEHFGVPGSTVLSYDHGTTVEARLPWTGEDVVDARLGERPVHLLTVVDVSRHGDELVLTLLRDNCRWFHERHIDMYAGVTLTLAGGGTAEVLFDRPLFVKSPMLASCPDRTLDRQDDRWGDYSG